MYVVDVLSSHIHVPSFTLSLKPIHACPDHSNVSVILVISYESSSEWMDANVVPNSVSQTQFAIIYNVSTTSIHLRDKTVVQTKVLINKNINIKHTFFPC